MKKTYLILIILTLVIGFATVTTNLVVSGKLNIGFNEDEFNVYISYASFIDGQNTTLVSADKQSVTFTTTGSDNAIEVDITNESSQYDAVVSISCTPESNENYTIESNVNENKVEAKDLLIGRVDVKTNEGSNENLEITCTLEVVAVSRTEKNTNEVKKRCEYELGTEWKFNYNGTFQTFNVPCDAIYKVELWGAQGGRSLCNGSACTNGGLGAYTKGNIKLNINSNLYVYVGGMGGNGTYRTSPAGGYNGGGSATWDNNDDESSGGGGGATDVRLVSGNWNDFNSLKSRIMVAAGGGGASFNYAVGYGGGLFANSLFGTTAGGTQTSGYAFGVGMNGQGVADSDGVAGGGGGYYGGRSANIGAKSTGTGGSSFISGHQGCDAIKETSTSSSIQHTGQPNHYSGLIFSDTVMIDGGGYNWTTQKEGYVGMPTQAGNSLMAGNSGNGYAKITLVMPTT